MQLASNDHADASDGLFSLQLLITLMLLQLLLLLAAQRATNNLNGDSVRAPCARLSVYEPCESM
jgi:hypothetical protein